MNSYDEPLAEWLLSLARPLIDNMNAADQWELHEATKAEKTGRPLSKAQRSVKQKFDEAFDLAIKQAAQPSPVQLQFRKKDEPTPLSARIRRSFVKGAVAKNANPDDVKAVNDAVGITAAIQRNMAKMTPKEQADINAGKFVARFDTMLREDLRKAPSVSANFTEGLTPDEEDQAPGPILSQFLADGSFNETAPEMESQDYPGSNFRVPSATDQGAGGGDDTISDSDAPGVTTPFTAQELAAAGLGGTVIPHISRAIKASAPPAWMGLTKTKVSKGGAASRNAKEASEKAADASTRAIETDDPADHRAAMQAHTAAATAHLAAAVRSNGQQRDYHNDMARQHSQAATEHKRACRS